MALATPDAWKKRKRQKMRSLARDRERGLVDDQIMPILRILNSLDGYFTTSSCAGRIVLLETPRIGDKLNAKLCATWHREVDAGEVRERLSEYLRGLGGGGRELWFISQGPIIHVSARDLDSAIKLREVAFSSGFKKSGILSISEKGVLLEVLSTERMDVPIVKDGVKLVGDEYIDFLVEKANNALRRSLKKLELLKNKLESMM